MTRPVLAVSSWVVKYPDEILGIVKNTEFQAIEWDLDYIPIPLSSKRLHKLKEELKRTEISLRYHLPHSTCDVGSGSPRIRRISEEYLHLNLEMISKLGADYAVLHLGQYEEQRIPPLASLNSIVKMASDHHITIAVENLPYGPTSNPEFLKRIAFESEAEIALDIGHARKVNALPDFLSLLSSRITHVHFYGFEDDTYNHRPFPSDEDALETANLIRSRSQAKWWTLEMSTMDDCIRLLGILKRIL